MIGMIARKNFTHGTRSYVRGERFTVKPIDAAVLRYQGKAKLIESRDMQAERATEERVDPPQVEQEPRRRRTYRRRDLTAEGSVKAQ